MFKNFINYFIWQLKKIPRKTYAKKKYIETSNLRNPYRYYLFEELKDIYGSNFFFNKKILEIGPKDGEDTLRLQNLKPESIQQNNMKKIIPKLIVNKITITLAGFFISIKEKKIV
tara:strand:- start:168 stop:512 length:345 start_codon:yes stop_codon:yes gene_type:complete